VDCPLRFPGQYYDTETGLHYNLHRYYNPETGAYLTPDPLGLEPSPNDHAFAPNPLIFCDPLGLDYENPTDMVLGAQDMGTDQLAVDLTINNDWTATHHLGKLPQGKSWRDYVPTHIRNPNIRIHVNTRGFEGGFIDSALRGMVTGCKATEEEMAWLAASVVRGERPWSTIMFYDKNGDILPLKEPAWSTDPKLSKMWLIWGDG
jgi:RHS repeat-associated protein